MSAEELDIFTPYCYDNLSKKRIGSKHDGGYVISTDIEYDYDLILSGGAGNNISFEEELSALYNIRCMIYDHSVNIKTKNKLIQHTKKKLNKDCSTFFDLVNDHNDIFLKLDIEGGEYEVISCLSDIQMKKFKQIVIELHHCYKKEKLAIIKKLFTNHTLIHLHGNNCCQLVDFHNIKVPPVLELTLIRNSEIKNETKKKNTQNIPTKLDFPNLKNRPDIQLNYYPFVVD